MKFEVMEIYLGYIGAFFIGFILGLAGCGGSVLAVPILVYLMHLNLVTATAYSLFIVGTSSAFGTVRNIQKGIVETKMAFIFAIPSFIAVFLTRKFIVPAIPDIVFESDNLIITRDFFLMILFAVLMLFSGISMLRGDVEDKDFTTKYNPAFIFFTTIVVGVVIGLVGAGGGFLIVPALFFMLKLSIRKAIGTSLLIITLNSLIGFTGDIGNVAIDWGFLLGFTGISVFGIVIGLGLSKYVNEQQLKKGFGWFVLIMAIFIFTKELFL